MTGPVFDAAFQEQLKTLLVWRRDVRRFADAPVAQETVHRLIGLACLAPSVGLSQPWRFVLVDEENRRRAVAEEFARCNALALAGYGPSDRALYARLKLEGLKEAPRQFAVFCEEETAIGRGLGRLTMPETLAYSVVAAVCNLWLAARAEGLGLGWISIIDPAAVAAILETPPSWRLIGYFCLGHPLREDVVPELELQDWERRRPQDGFILQR